MDLKELTKTCMRKKAELLDESAFASDVVMKFIDEHEEVCEQFYDNIKRYALYPVAVTDMEFCPFCFKYYGSCDDCDFGKAYGVCPDEGSIYQEVLSNTNHSLGRILYEKGYVAYLRNLLGIEIPEFKAGDKVKLNELFGYMYSSDLGVGVVLDKTTENEEYVHIRANGNEVYVPKTVLVKAY